MYMCVYVNICIQVYIGVYMCRPIIRTVRALDTRCARKVKSIKSQQKNIEIYGNVQNRYEKTRTHIETSGEYGIIEDIEIYRKYANYGNRSKTTETLNIIYKYAETYENIQTPIEVYRNIKKRTENYANI